MLVECVACYNDERDYDGATSIRAKMMIRRDLVLNYNDVRMTAAFVLG